MDRTQTNQRIARLALAWLGVALALAFIGTFIGIAPSQAYAQDAASNMVIKDGAAQPVFSFTDPASEGYSNATSEIWHFAVYVESDYDTDLDGKRDLVKAFVQVPRAAVEGKYRAPVIYEASPYVAGSKNRSP
ncbi:MAG: hypothetical protein Q4B54_06375, partial [Coriobacteriales bacterium]|nr:hypothetical protein [Coriobacteriales bacterium]